jgi:hypothetical protein
MMPQAIEALLIGEQHEPVCALEAGWFRLPNFPLAKFHRSGFCVRAFA